MPSGAHRNERLRIARKLAIALRFHDSVNPGEADVSLAALSQQVLRQVECLGHIDGADANPEHVRPGRAHRFRSEA